MFWVAAILLTALAVLSVLLPFVRRREAAREPAANDLEVYRDQMAELDRDVGRGLIGGPEAEEARAEIGRRILKAAQAGNPAGQSVQGFPMARAVALAAVLSVPLVGWGLYGLVGSPDLPSQPLAARLSTDPAKAPVEELVARAEAHLTAFPDDGQGWDVLAPVYFRLGRYADASEAYRQAIRLVGDSADREAGLGESLAGEAGGLITDEAQAAFRKGLELEPDHPKARFFLAGALAQQGRAADAVSAWTAMKAGLPADSPWRVAVDRALAETGRQLTDVNAGAARNGPSQTDIDAASQMSADDRNAMIAGMVARLDERLKENPKDAEGWQRLVRSYVVLGRTDEARSALSRGIAALGENTPEAARLQEFAASLGLTRTE
jgi:cytochrome c-type biogenesis protein CcmH